MCWVLGLKKKAKMLILIRIYIVKNKKGQTCEFNAIESVNVIVVVIIQIKPAHLYSTRDVAISNLFKVQVFMYIYIYL